MAGIWLRVYLGSGPGSNTLGGSRNVGVHVGGLPRYEHRVQRWTFKCLLLFVPALFWKGEEKSLTECEACCFNHGGQQALVSFCNHIPNASTVTTACTPLPCFYVCAGYLSSDPHACTAPDLWHPSQHLYCINCVPIDEVSEPPSSLSTSILKMGSANKGSSSLKCWCFCRLGLL